MKPTRKLSRRSFLGQITGGLAGFGALGLISSDARAFQVTDCDPRDPGGQGTGRNPRTGVTDRDPNDPGGCGRGEIRQRGTGPEPQYAPRSPYEDDGVRRRTSGITDSDPSDPAGDGRGGPSRAPSNPYDEGGSRQRPEDQMRQRGTGPEPQYPPRSPYEDDGVRQRTSGVTDSDPSDPVGNGRGTGPRRCSDSDFGTGSDPIGRGRRC